MKKVLDIDEFLKDNGVTVILKGKKYEVKDIPLEMRQYLDGDDVDHKKAVAVLLGCSESELDGLGLAALSKIITDVHVNLLPKPPSADAP